MAALPIARHVLHSGIPCTLPLYLAVFHYMDNFHFCNCVLICCPGIGPPGTRICSSATCELAAWGPMYHCCTSNRTAHWFNGAVHLYLEVFHYMDNCRFCIPGLPSLLVCCPESSYASRCCPGHAYLGAHSCSCTAPGLGF